MYNPLVEIQSCSHIIYQFNIISQYVSFIANLLISIRLFSFQFQLTFDSFTLGRFVSFTSDGCPDGALQISESNRPQVGGSWCGTSWGPSIYYSETNSVSIFVSLYRLSKENSGYNFDFRMEYKFLRKGSATVRYGGGKILSITYINCQSLIVFIKLKNCK